MVGIFPYILLSHIKTPLCREIFTISFIHCSFCNNNITIECQIQFEA